MFAEQIEVESSLIGEWIFDVGVEVDGQKSATVVGTEWDLAARIGRDGLEPEIGIAVGEGFACYGVPEQHSRFGRFPCVVYYFLPQTGGVGFMCDPRVGIIGRELLLERSAVNGCLHEVVGYPY